MSMNYLGQDTTGVIRVGNSGNEHIELVQVDDLNTGPRTSSAVLNKTKCTKSHITIWHLAIL